MRRVASSHLDLHTGSEGSTSPGAIRDIFPLCPAPSRPNTLANTAFLRLKARRWRRNPGRRRSGIAGQNTCPSTGSLGRTHQGLTEGNWHRPSKQVERDLVGLAWLSLFILNPTISHPPLTSPVLGHLSRFGFPRPQGHHVSANDSVIVVHITPRNGTLGLSLRGGSDDPAQR